MTPQEAVAAIKAAGGEVTVSASDGTAGVELIGKEQLSEHIIDAIGRIPDLEKLDLGGTQLRNDGLKRLAALKLAKLKELDLGSSGITDDGLPYLEAFPALEVLNIGWKRNHITDAGMKHLRPLRNLRVLDLTRSQVRREGLAELGALPKLEELIHLCCDSELDDESLRQIGTLTRLRVLRFWAPEATDEGIAHLRNLSRLEVLLAAADQATPAAAKTYAALKNLRELHARPLDDGALRLLSGLAKLERLRLSGPITDAGAVELTKFPALRELDISFAPRLTAECAPTLATMTRLTRLRLSSTHIPAESIEQLRKALPGTEVKFWP